MNFNLREKKNMIITLFCMTYTISNVITIKIINLGFLNLAIPASVFSYPLISVLTNVITQVYGERTADKVLIQAILVNALFVFMTTLILILPSPSNYSGNSSLAFVFTQTPRILIASCISFLIGNFVNARLTTILNRSESNLTIRNYTAIAIGQLVDNVLFIGLSFIGSMPLINIIIMMLVYWTFGLVWCAIAQPFTNITVKWVRKGEDVPTIPTKK